MASNTNSWLSSVLNENPSNGMPTVEDRPHTWGPSNNRYSSATDDGDSLSDRNSLSQLVRITEDAHISSPIPSNAAVDRDRALPSLPSLFSGPGSAATTPTTLNSRPQLSANRSYTKNLILPRPDSYPPPKGYPHQLPMADQRPPALPPAGSEGSFVSSTTPTSATRSTFNMALTKPLPPLPKDAKDSKDGMDVLLQAAGV
jgi:C2H2 transcription facotor